MGTYILVVTLLYISIIEVWGVAISHVTAPSVVLCGEELTIDCDFEYQKDEQDQLDLKWYFNSSPFPIYQWVPSMHKGPQVIGELFKHSLDLLYSAHNDTFKKHRALHIPSPDHRFSGTYMCKVSSFVDEDFQQKEILVIAPPRQTQLRPAVSASDENMLNVSCIVSGVFPTPTVVMSWTVNSTTTILEDIHTVVKVRHNGLLDVSVSSLVEKEHIEQEGVIGCEVTIPKSEFYVREELELLQFPKLLSRYTSDGVQRETGRGGLGLLLSLLLLTLTGRTL